LFLHVDFLCLPLDIQSLYGAHELRILNPLTLWRTHLFRVNRLGNVNTFLSDFLTHFLCFDVWLQQSMYFIYISIDFSFKMPNVLDDVERNI